MSDSKEHIIIVASKLFLQKSFKEVTMKEIVKETGLSKGAFYHYFESKEQLFLEVLDYFFNNFMKHSYENFSRTSFYQFYHDYANEIRSYSNMYMSIFIGTETENEFNINYFSLAFDALRLFPDFKANMIIKLDEEIAIWTEVIRDARANGEIKSVMTDNDIAQLFISLGDGIGMTMVMRGSSIEEMVVPFLNLWDKLYEQIKV
jgi:TetR/AcrR family transcriptional regulator, transcriptional repressor for nem operon